MNSAVLFVCLSQVLLKFAVCMQINPITGMPEPAMMGQQMLSPVGSFNNKMGGIGGCAAQRNEFMYTSQYLQQVDQMCMTQHHVQQSLLPIFTNFYQMKNKAKLRFKSACKTPDLSAEKPKKLLKFYKKLMKKQVLNSLSMHYVARQAVMQAMGFPCQTIYVQSAGCTQEMFVQMVTKIQTNVHLMRKFFIVIKNCPGMIQNQYNFAQVHPSWGNQFQQFYSGQFQSMTSTSGMVNHMATGVPPMGVQPMGVQPMGVQPMGVQPMGVQPMGVQPMGVQTMGVPVGVPGMPTF